MKAALILFLLASPVFAQDKPKAPAVAPGCGAEDAKFDVKKVKGQRPIAQPDVGKALVYFIEDDTDFDSIFKPTTRAGLDGGWVGATHGNSYFFFSVAPGEHHLCASKQSADDLPKKAVAHFTAEPGNVYYFRVKNRWRRDYAFGDYEIDFAPLDSDQGLLLASTYSSVNSHVRR